MVLDTQLIITPLEKLHLEILPKSTQKAFLESITFDFLPPWQWYLAGGTALALQVGHRQSVDLDFFTPRRTFKGRDLERKLFNTDKWVTSLQDEGTLYGELLGAKASFIAYPFFRPSSARLQCGQICLLTTPDIAAMKIVAISQRGRKRDFFDLYWCALHRESLIDIIQAALHQYPGQEHNLPHILKSLVYFADAETDPMPNILFNANWKIVKEYFQKEVPRIAKILLKFT